MSYDEWKNAHKATPPQIVTPAAPPTPAPVYMQGVRRALGNDYANAMETLLNFTEEPDVEDLYHKYGDRLDAVNDPAMSTGALFNPRDGKVYMNTKEQLTVMISTNHIKQPFTSLGITSTGLLDWTLGASISTFR